MLRNIFWTSCFCLYGFLLIAQTETKEQSIYFESGSYQLNSEGKEVLDAFLMELNQLPDFDLDLRAYTDDVGDTEANKRLAKKRAASVKEYFNKKGIYPTKSELSEAKELKMKDIDPTNMKSMDELRRENRRVDILVSIFAPTSLKDCLYYFEKRDIDYYPINAKRYNTVNLEKGTTLEIPADAFVSANGSLIGKVVLSVKEVRKNGDAFINNVGTICRGRLLHNQVQLCIKAYSESGALLRLREDRPIRIKIYTNGDLHPDTRVFTGTVIDNVKDRLDWRMTNAIDIKSETPFATDVPPYFYGVSSLQSIEELTFDQLKLPSFPSRVPSPSAPEEPVLKLENNTQPVYDEVVSAYERQKGESKKKYEERVKRVYDQRMTVYNERNALNESRKKKYDEDIAKYRSDLQKYEENKKKYADYLQKFVDLKSSLTKQRSMFEEQLSEIHIPERWTNEELLYLERMSKKLETYHAYLKKEAKLHQLTQSAKELESYSFLNKDKFDGANKQWKSLARIVKQNYETFNRQKIDRRISTIEDYMDNLGNKESSEDNEWKTRKFSTDVRSVQDYVKLFNKNATEYNDMLEETDLQGILDALDQYRDRLEKSYDKVVAEKKRKGMLKDNGGQHKHSIKITKLGWIAFQRFLKASMSTQVTVKIPFPEDRSTRFYLFVKETQSVIPLYPNGRGVYANTLNGGLDITGEVDIIGLRVEGEHAKVYQGKSTLRDLHNIKPEFKTIKLNQMRALVNKLNAMP